MQVRVTTKQFHISKEDNIFIQKKVGKLLELLPWKDPDFPTLDITLRNYKERGKKDHVIDDDYENFPSKEKRFKNPDSPTYYEGLVCLTLPKKKLIVKILGKTLTEALKNGFDELFREFEKYKGMYFTDNSAYKGRKHSKKSEELG